MCVSSPLSLIKLAVGSLLFVFTEQCVARIHLLTFHRYANHKDIYECFLFAAIYSAYLLRVACIIYLLSRTFCSRRCTILRPHKAEFLSNSKILHSTV